MPRAYKGRMIMECMRETCSRDRARADVKPDCLDCSAAQITIIDLADKPVGRKGPDQMIMDDVGIGPRPIREDDEEEAAPAPITETKRKGRK